MGLFSHDSDEAQAHTEVVNSPHKGHLSHSLIAAAASYEAAKGYQDHVAKHGQPSSHEQAKSILAGLAGGFIDHIVETKGLDFVDAQKAKHDAKKNAEQALENSGQF